MIRLCIALIAVFLLASTASGQNRTARTSVGQAGQRQSRGDTVRGSTPLMRIDNRLQNRIDTRLDRRIDVNGTPAQGLLNSFDAAAKNTQQTGKAKAANP
jgi:hypothetical protein